MSFQQLLERKSATPGKEKKKADKELKKLATIHATRSADH